jgi:hypothetical protein
MRRGAVVTLLWTALSAVLVWAFDHFAWDWLTHILETWFGAKWTDLIARTSSFVLPLLIAAGLLWVVYRIAKEPPAATKPQPDMKISDAIDYIVNDSRAILSNPKKLPPSPWPSFLPPPAPGSTLTHSGVEHQDARKQLNAKLISGELHSWGLRQIATHIPNQFEHSIREIPKEYWDDMQLDFQSCLYYKGPYSQTMKIPGRTERHNWADIQVSRGQVEMFWPKKSASARLWSKILRKPRISHTRISSVPETPVPIEPEDSLQILTGTGKLFENVVVNEYGVLRTISIGVKNIGSKKITNCTFYRTYVSSMNDNEKVLLDGPFSLDPAETRYISIAMFNETKDLPHATHLIGLSLPPGAFGAGVMQPRLFPDRRHVVSFAIESPDASDATLHCELWVDESGKLRIANV